MAERAVFYAYMPRSNATARQRAYLIAEGLSNRGVDARVEPALSEKGLRRYADPRGLGDRAAWATEMTATRVKQAWRHPKASVAVIQRELLPIGPPTLEHLIVSRASATVIDIDDAVHLSSQDRPHTRLGRAMMPEDKIARTLAMVDGVVCGNERLAEDLAASGARRTWVVPTCVEFDEMPQPSPRPHGGPLRLVWLGNSGNLHMLRMLAEPLSRLAEEGLEITLTAMSSRAPNAEETGGQAVNFVPWSLEEEAAVLAASDIGVMPLPDDEYSRRKCGFKILRYAAAGLPAIASPVGVNASMLQHGTTGMLASNAFEWAAAIRLLTASGREGRAAMGAAARADLMARFGIERAVRDWDSILGEL